MAFFEHSSFNDANGKAYRNVPVSGAHDNASSAGNNITPAKAVGNVIIPIFGNLGNKKYSDVIEYNKYVSQLSSIPYMGLDETTPILLPLGSKNKLAVKFTNSIPIKELIDSVEQKGNAYTGTIYKQYIISHTIASIFRKLSRKDEYVIDPTTWDYLGITNGKLNGIRVSTAPENEGLGQVQCKTGSELFSRQGGKSAFRTKLGNFRYYASWYKHTGFQLDQSKLDSHVSSKLGKKVKVLDFTTETIDNTSIIFWEILLSRVIGDNYIGSGLSFPFRLKGESKDRIFTINIDTKTFVDEQGNQYKGLVGNSYTISFNLQEFIQEETWKQIKPYINTFVNRVKDNYFKTQYNKIKSDVKYWSEFGNLFFHFFDDNYHPVNERKYTLKRQTKPSPSTTITDYKNGNVVNVSIGGVYKQSERLELRGDTPSGSQTDPYPQIPITNKDYLPYANEEFELAEYLHSNYLTNTSLDYSDTGKKVNTIENTVLEMTYTGKLRPKVPSYSTDEDTEDVNQDDVTFLDQDRYSPKATLPEDTIGEYIEYPILYDYHKLKYNEVVGEEIIILNCSRQDTKTNGNISTISVTPMFMVKNITLDVKIFTQEFSFDIIESENGDIPSEGKLDEEKYTDLTISPFLYVLDDYQTKEATIPSSNPSDKPTKVKYLDYNPYREPKSYSYNINKHALDLVNQFGEKGDIILVTYEDSKGVIRKEYITYTDKELNGDSPINYFMKQTHKVQDTLLRHVPSLPLWFQDSPIGQKTHNYIEILILFIPYPGGLLIIPIPIPRKGKALYAQAHKDGFYNTSDKWTNLYFRKNEIRNDYYDRFEDPTYIQNFRDNLKINNTKRTPRPFGDRSFINYIERPFTCKTPSGSAGNWSYTPYPYNKKNFDQSPTSIEKDYTASLKFGESYQAYYSMNNMNNLTKVYMSKRFSLTYMLNTELRNTVQPCKMAYQYINYLCKINGIPYQNTFSTVSVHTPSRIAFRCFNKTLKIRRINIPDDEANLMSKAYDAVFDGDILKVRCKAQKVACHLDFNSYINNYKEIYGVGLGVADSIIFNTNEITKEVPNLWRKYYSKYKYPNGAIKQLEPPYTSSIMVGTNYIKGLSYNDLVSAYNLVFGTSEKPNELLSSNSIIELKDEYNSYNMGNLIIDETGTKNIEKIALVTRMVREHTYRYKTKVEDPVTGEVKTVIEISEPKNIGVYDNSETLYWYNKHYVSNWDEYSNKMSIRSLKNDVVDLGLTKEAMENALIEELQNSLGSTPFICKESDYIIRFNLNTPLVKFFNSSKDSSYHWKKLFSKYTFIVPNDIVDLNSTIGGSPRLQSILKINSQIVDPNRSIQVSNPYLPLFEEFYRKLSYTNKHFIHRTMWNMDMLSGVVVPVKYKNGSRWSFATALIQFVGTVITIAFSWTGTSSIIRVAMIIQLSAQSLSIYGRFFAKGEMQAKILKLAGSLAIVSTVLMLYGSMGNFTADQMDKLTTLEKISRLANLTNQIMTVVNYITDAILNAKIKKQQEEIDRAKKDGEIILNQLEEATDHYIGMNGETNHFNMSLQSILDWSIDKSELADLDAYTNISLELLYNYDNELENIYKD